MALPASLLRHKVTRVRPVVTVDAHNNQVKDYGPTARREPLYAWLQQGAHSETFSDGRNAVEQVWTLLANCVDLDDNERIEWAEHPAGTMVFEVTGSPEPAYNLAAGAHHVEATLRIVDG